MEPTKQTRWSGLTTRTTRRCVSLVLAAALAAVLGSSWSLGSVGAVDRQGNPGRGTGWLVTDAGRYEQAPFWAGTHVLDDGTEGLCLEFAHQGPTERIDHGYRPVGAPAALSAGQLAAIGYLASLVGAAGPDSPERRDLAAAAAYATWALAEGAGMPTSSSRGVPGGAWAAWWGSGMPSGSPVVTDLDPGMDPARVRRQHELLRTGVAAVTAGVGNDWRVEMEASAPGPDDGRVELVVVVTLEGRRVPLVSVVVTDVVGVAGVEVGHDVRTDDQGRAVVTATPMGGGVGASLTLEVRLPGVPRFFATDRPIRGAPAQTLVVAGQPIPMSLRWEQAPAPETVPPETVPPETVPPETVPPETVPPETVPPETVPPETVPPETVPPETVPPETVPPETVPPETVPPETVPPIVESPVPSPDPATTAPTTTTTTSTTTVVRSLPTTGSGPALRQGAAAVGLLLAGWGLALQARRRASPS